AAKFYRVWVEGEPGDPGAIPPVPPVEGHGSDFDTLSLTASWAYDTRDRTFLADDGHLTRFSGEFTVPGGDLEYYKFTLSQDSNWGLGKGFTFHVKGLLSYGDAYGDTQQLPFFERFYAGGSRSVRGYEGNSLGPRDNQLFPAEGTDDVIGGVLKVVGNIELIFPLPFVENSRSFRVGTFIDAGNVFLDRDSYESRDLRASYGVFALWVTPVGVLSFNWGFPINDKEGDETELFQFTIGAPF
ncbi:MAG: BamA/TamA family outer membrane protein, partial [Gammaproteobacteria bacterium]|nr:BamA/TamA family outer membrane protein [Gammaproteobacteria bacterium]